MSHRVYAAVPVSGAEQMITRGREKTPDDMFDVRGIEVFIDGTLGSRGAALISNYSDADHNGFMNRTTKDDLVPILHAALRHRIQIETHVIGDLNFAPDRLGQDRLSYAYPWQQLVDRSRSTNMLTSLSSMQT